MAENKMSEVAKLLSLELREEFKIQGLSLRYRLINIGLQYYNETEGGWVTSNKLLPMLLAGEISIIKVKQPILDDVEKRYLSNVIKPFRNRIICIIKNKCLPDEYLRIHLKHYTGKYANEIIYLPYFKNGSMYKGMEINKEYTLKELGL